MQDHNIGGGIDEAEMLQPVEEPTPAIPFTRLKRWYESAVWTAEANNAECIEDRKYYDGDQLSPTEKAFLKQRGQPEFYTNRTAHAVDGMLGIIDNTEGAPEAHPRTLAARDAADVATKTLRFVVDSSRYSEERKLLSANFLIEGTCAAIVDVDGDRINASAIDWEDFFFDPFARRADFKDARFLGITKKVELDQIEALYPDAPFKMDGCFEGGFFNDKDDARRAIAWLDQERRLVNIVEMYYRDEVGDWHRAVFCERGLFEAGKSIYLNEKGQTDCPIHALSYRVKRDGTRKGYVRDLRPLQKETNARRSKLLHLLNNRQLMITDVQQASLTDPSEASRQAALPNGILPPGYALSETQDMAANQMLVYQESKSEFDRAGPTPGVLANLGPEMSGRSRQLVQQAGLTEQERTMSNWEEFETRLYEAMWTRARQFYRAPMWIRATGDRRAPEFIQINEIVGTTVTVDPETGVPTQTPIVRNRLADMECDIKIAEVADTNTLREETWAQMLQYAASARLDILSPGFRALLKASPIPNSREICEELKALSDELAQEQAPQQQMQMQAMQAQQQIEAAQANAKAMKDQAAAHKHSADATKVDLENAMVTHQLQSLMAQVQPPNPGF